MKTVTEIRRNRARGAFIVQREQGKGRVKIKLKKIQIKTTIATSKK